MSSALVKQLKPYLALLPYADDCLKVHLHLVNKISRAVKSPPYLVLLAVLDGSPERARHLLGLSYDNQEIQASAATLQAIENKDEVFFTTAGRAIESQNGLVLDYCDCPPGVSPLSPKYRAWQDGIVAVFTGQKSVAQALQATRNISQACSRINAAQHYVWHQQYHPRFVIAPSLVDALSYLPHAMRDETAMDDNLVDTVPRQDLSGHKICRMRSPISARAS